MKVDNQNIFLSRLDANSLIKNEGERGAIKTVSTKFEAFFLKSVLKEMRKANDALADKDSVFSSKKSGIYRDWYDDQMVASLSDKQSVGLADIMTTQLTGKTERSQLSSLKSMKNPINKIRGK